MKIGILTGGGDCPGLNAVIRAIVRKGIFHHSDEFVGFLEGWRGVLENTVRPLDLEAVAGILPRGGTILRTSRTNPAKREGGIQRCIDNLKRNGVEALVALGGDDGSGVLRLYAKRPEVSVSALRQSWRGTSAGGIPSQPSMVATNTPSAAIRRTVGQSARCTTRCSPLSSGAKARSIIARSRC